MNIKKNPRPRNTSTFLRAEPSVRFFWESFEGVLGRSLGPLNSGFSNGMISFTVNQCSQKLTSLFTYICIS